MYDYSLFYKKEVSSAVYVPIYVDDIIINSSDLSKIEELKRVLYHKFKIKIKAICTNS